MNVGTERFLEVYGKQRVIVQTECHLARCSRHHTSNVVNNLLAFRARAQHNGSSRFSQLGL